MPKLLEAPALIAAALILAAAASGARAAPVRLEAIAREDVVPIQMQCDPARCWDTRTGAYTGSTCDYRGCRPNTGVLGYLNAPPTPAPGYRRGYNQPPYYADQYAAPPAYGYGRRNSVPIVPRGGWQQPGYDYPYPR